MKTNLSLIFLVLIELVLGCAIVVPARAQLRCLTANKYSKLSGGGKLTNVSKKAVVCFNDRYFSFYTPEVGTRTFAIDAVSFDSTTEGYVRQRFLNAEDNTNQRGDYSVEIDYESVKTVVITFTRFGQAYIIQAKSFVGSMESVAVGPSIWVEEVKKVKVATPRVDSIKAKPVIQCLNSIDPKILEKEIKARIAQRSPLIASFVAKFDEKGALISILPEKPLPERYDSDIQLVQQAAKGVTVPPCIKDGSPVPSYTFLRIDLH